MTLKEQFCCNNCLNCHEPAQLGVKFRYTVCSSASVALSGTDTVRGADVTRSGRGANHVARTRELFKPSEVHSRAPSATPGKMATAGEGTCWLIPHLGAEIAKLCVSSQTATIERKAGIRGKASKTYTNLNPHEGFKRGQSCCF